ncbi:hypothetical protein JVU11DRAFT_519 [Chiua virens]|nr:hypothetical protein JVU11DRAFT_519 [Chiua virens]
MSCDSKAVYVDYLTILVFHMLTIHVQVIPRVFGPVFTVTVFATVVAFARSKGHAVELANSVVPLLSVVVGLILVFRTSYDRYWEGRRCFSTLTANVRNLSRMLWIHVALAPTGNDTQARMTNPPLSHAELKRQKIETLRYCLGFVYAVKHYLRGEDGGEYADLAGVLPPRFCLHRSLGHTTNKSQPFVASYAATQGDPSNTSAGDRRSADATKRVKPKRSKKNVGATNQSSGSTTPLLSDSHQTVEFHPYADHISMPLPLIIAHEISTAIFKFKREGMLETVGPAGKPGK